MKQTSKKALHLKIALVSIFAICSPILLNLFLNLNTIFSILASIISTALAVTLLFWFLKPINALVKGVKGFSDGNLNSRVNIRSGDVLEEVGNSFNLMADKVTQVIQRLENDRNIAISEKNKFDEILSSMSEGIIALDFNKNIIFLNKTAEQLIGNSREEVYGKSIDQIIHLFVDADELLAKTYCSSDFNQAVKLVGREGRQTKVSLITTQVGGKYQSSLNCILILHDLSREEELEQMKLDFVSMASHELKTPLTSIIGYLSVYLDENKNKLTKDDLMLLDKAFIAAQQLQTLIANILNVNKIEREQLAVSATPIDYLPVLSKVIEDLKSQASQKDITLALVPPIQPLPKVLGDPVRLNEVVTNLASNAINYTNPGGRVEISTRLLSTEVETIISDTGIGIPPEALPHLFSKFFRVSNDLQKASKGTGLGLYITKSIIEKLQGKVWVQSEIGKGSKFFFTLPIATQNADILNQNKFVSEAIQSGTLNY